MCKDKEFFSRSQQLKRAFLFQHATWQKCADTVEDSSEPTYKFPIFSFQISQDVSLQLHSPYWPVYMLLRHVERHTMFQHFEASIKHGIIYLRRTSDCIFDGPQPLCWRNFSWQTIPLQDQLEMLCLFLFLFQ